MKPVVIRKEIEAFVGDRLLEAAWREALWLIKDGICTVEELDDIMRYGFGLRWAQMGMFQVYRVAGGEAGMRHFMAQFGPALKWPWTKLMDVPEFNDELVDLIADAVGRAGARPVDPRARKDPRRQSGRHHGGAVEAEQGQGLGRRRTAQRLYEAARQAGGEEAEGLEIRRESQGRKAGEERPSPTRKRPARRRAEPWISAFRKNSGLLSRRRARSSKTSSTRTSWRSSVPACCGPI